MAAAPREPAAAQVKVDLLLVGDVTLMNLADAVQKLFSGAAEVTTMVSDVKKAAVFLDVCTFDMVFLKMTSLPLTEELEAVRLIRFAKKKNTHLLFVFVIPENFEDCISGHGADIILVEPLTVEKMSILVNYWKACFSKVGKSETVVSSEDGLPLQRPRREQRKRFSAALGTCSHSLGDIGLELESPLSDLKKSQSQSQRSYLIHSNKEKLRRERIKQCCEHLRALLPYSEERKSDMASVLEATVEYMKDIRKKIPPVVMGQITELLRNNERFRVKQHRSSSPSAPGRVVVRRKSCAQSDACSPVMDLRLLDGESANECSVPAAGDSGDSAGAGPSAGRYMGSPAEACGGPAPGVAVPLGPFPATLPVRCSRAATAPPEALTRQDVLVPGPSAASKASRRLRHQCSSQLGQAHSAHPDCLQQL